MSITDLKALTESCFIEARKFPAAPALLDVNVKATDIGKRSISWIVAVVHHEVNRTQLLGTSIYSFFQAVVFPHIHGAYTDDSGTSSRGGDVLGSLFRLVNVSAHDARIRTEMD